MGRNETRAPLTGWWLVVDRALVILFLLIAIAGIVGLTREGMPGWWPLALIGLLLVGAGIRVLVERHRGPAEAPSEPNS